MRGTRQDEQAAQRPDGGGEGRGAYPTTVSNAMRSRPARHAGTASPRSRRGVERGARTARHCGDHHRLVGDRQGLVHVVADDDAGPAQRVVEALDRAWITPEAIGVQAGQRLVVERRGGSSASARAPAPHGAPCRRTARAGRRRRARAGRPHYSPSRRIVPRAAWYACAAAAPRSPPWSGRSAGRCPCSRHAARHGWPNTSTVPAAGGGSPVSAAGRRRFAAAGRAKDGCNAAARYVGPMPRRMVRPRRSRRRPDRCTAGASAAGPWRRRAGPWTGVNGLTEKQRRSFFAASG